MLRFSSPRFSFVALSFAFIAGMTVVGIGLAQLTIPTTLTNATIYIKDLFVSTDGSNTPANQKIILDGSAGTVTVKNLANTPVLGVDANGWVIPQTSTAVYNYIAGQVSWAVNSTMASYTGFVVCPYSTGCVWQAPFSGSNGNGSGDNGRYYNPKGEAPTNTGITDIYFADPAIAGPDAVVRIGMQDPANNNSANYITNDLDGSQLIVKGEIESRTSFKIRGNMDQLNNDKVDLSNNYFETNIRKWLWSLSDALRIDTESPNWSYIAIKNDNYATKVGINTLTLPTATLDIANILSTNGTTTLSLDSKVGNGISNASAASISHTRSNNAYDASLNLGTVNSSFVSTQKVKIASSGDSYINGWYLGIGLTDPQVALHISGAVRGDAYYYNSDRRLKTDIAIIDNALALINALHGYTFTWKTDGKKSVGLIAQEVEKVFPDLVDTDSLGFKSVQYGNLVAPIIEAIHILTDKIDTLFDTYISQQKQIDALEARIARLEALAPRY